MNEIFGFNPAAQVATWFAGDWHGLATNASALENLSRFEHDLSDNVGRCLADVSQSWEGQAADAANQYFSNLVESLTGHAEALQRISTQYTATADGVWASAKAAVSGLEMLADILLDIALDLAATALLSETGVGLVAGSAIVGYLGVKATSIWFKIIALHGKVFAATEGIVGIITGELSTLNGLTQTPIPGAAYDNKLVAP